MVRLEKGVQKMLETGNKYIKKLNGKLIEPKYTKNIRLL